MTTNKSYNLFILYRFRQNGKGKRSEFFKIIYQQFNKHNITNKYRDYKKKEHKDNKNKIGIIRITGKTLKLELEHWDNTIKMNTGDNT